MSASPVSLCWYSEPYDVLKHTSYLYVVICSEMETAVVQDQNGSTEENSGEFAAVLTSHVNQDGFSDVSYVWIMFSARLFDKISSLTVQCAQRSNCLVKLLDFLFYKTRCFESYISYWMDRVIYFSLWYIWTFITRMIYIIVFTSILIRNREIESRPVLQLTKFRKYYWMKMAYLCFPL